MIAVAATDTVQICAESRGAELLSLKHRRDGVERLWKGDPAFWGRRAPILFPIVGRLAENRYLFGGKEYALSQHGFARDREFKLIESSPARLLYRLSSDDETLRLYPFPFDLLVGYRLERSRLEVHHRVTNTGPSPMWFSIGGHPGFACPLKKDESFEEYELVFEEKETLPRHFLQSGLLTGESAPLLEDSDRLPLSWSLFERDAIVLQGLRSKWVELRNRSGRVRLSVHFEGWPYLGIWTRPGAPFVCIEPWQGLADRAGAPGLLEEKEGIVSLEPGDRWERSYFVEIREA